MWVHKLGICRSGEVPIYDVVKVAAPYDLGFVLEMFIVGPLSGFITDESGKKAMKCWEPRPIFVGHGP